MVLVVVGIIIFGAKKIPEFARSLGKAQGEYQKARGEVQQELDTSDRLDLAVERSKLDEVASKLGIENSHSLGDEDLRDAIQHHLRK